MSKYLRRYTHLPALLYMLNERKITLLSPATWDDTNDSHYLLRYKEKKKLKTVLALCFSQSDETYHHWRIFSGSAAGVCIRFDQDSLRDALGKGTLVPKRFSILKPSPTSISKQEHSLIKLSLCSKYTASLR